MKNWEKVRDSLTYEEVRDLFLQKYTVKRSDNSLFLCNRSNCRYCRFGEAIFYTCHDLKIEWLNKECEEYKG